MLLYWFFSFFIFYFFFLILLEPTTPKPEVPNPVTEGLQQSAQALWELSKIHKELAGKL